tara:strand:+ start:726 stop:941 length:216 start_codon:yes stop_codon:yes gene_type:complete
MTDDLVKRLRAETDGATVNPDGLEAADHIEALEKRGLVLEDYIRGLLTVVDDLEKVLEHFRGRIREMEGTK